MGQDYKKLLNKKKKKSNRHYPAADTHKFLEEKVIDIIDRHYLSSFSLLNLISNNIDKYSISSTILSCSIFPY